MDPVSLTAAALAFIKTLKYLQEVSSRALSCANSLAEINKDQAQAVAAVSTSVVTLHRLHILREEISKITDEQIRNLFIPRNCLEQHLSATEALLSSLQAEQRRQKSKLRRLIKGFRLILLPEGQPGGSELQARLRSFQDSLGVITSVLSIFQSYILASLRNTTETNHETSVEKLDNIINSQVLSRDLGENILQTVGTSSQKVQDFRDVVVKSTKTLSELGDGFDRAAEQVRHVDQTVTRTEERIMGLCQSFEVVDQRIQEFSSHRSLFSATPRKVFDIPYPRNKWFTGRDEILAAIDRQLLLPAPCRGEAGKNGGAAPSVDETRLAVFVVHGLPGVGKSHVAIEFAYRHRKDFSHIFWISSDTAEKIEHGFVSIARVLGLTSDKTVEDELKVGNLARSWMKKPPKGAKWLIVFDNLEDFRLLNSFWAGLRCGAVLITSKGRVDGLAALGCSHGSGKLGQFSDAEGAAMVKKRLGSKDLGLLGDDAARDIARRFGLFPLYMDQMMSFLASLALTPQQLHAQLESYEGDHELQNISGDSPWYTESVAKAIEAYLGKKTELERTVLAIISFFDPDRIPQRLLESSAGRVKALSGSWTCSKVLHFLAASSLINVNGRSEAGGEEPWLNLHRLVRDAALRSSPRLQPAFEDAVELLRASFPLHKESRDHMVEDWDECEVFQPHVLSLHQQYVELRRKTEVRPSFAFIELVYSCAWYLCERSRFEISKRLISTINLDYRELTRQDPDTPRGFLADILTVQLFYHNETDHGCSLIELAFKAMEIRETLVLAKLMDEHHPNRANGFMNLGVVMTEADPVRAIELHLKALEVRLGSQIYTADHGLALNHLNIGRCWWVVGDLQKAAASFEMCMAIMKVRETATNKKFPLTAWAMSALGIVRAEQGDLNAAISLLSTSAELHAATMGVQNMKTLACYYRLAWACHLTGDTRRYKQSRKLLTVMLAEYRRFSSPPSPEIARVNFKLAQVLRDLGHAEAECLVYANEAKLLLEQVSGSKVEGFGTESEYDKCIPYFLR